MKFVPSIILKNFIDQVKSIDCSPYDVDNNYNQIRRINLRRRLKYIQITTILYRDCICKSNCWDKLAQICQWSD